MNFCSVGNTLVDKKIDFFIQWVGDEPFYISYPFQAFALVKLVVASGVSI